MTNMPAINEYTANPQVVKARAQVLKNLIDGISLEGTRVAQAHPPTLYDSKVPVDIELTEYLIRWVTYTSRNSDVLIAAACLIDRFLRKSQITLTCFNMHRITLGSLITAEKLMLDTPYKNSYYAQIGGVSLMEICRIEKAFLIDCDFEVFISSEDFMKYKMFFSTCEEKINVQQTQIVHQPVHAQHPIVVQRIPQQRPQHCIRQQALPSYQVVQVRA
eukprot:TRINITY_DN18344_c0_g1_i1.p1 TRINITY_DN18344_c0_g1~~TRINITY_DN18344_c0_g1_i1.p1  ORF type:complete len:245 (+),score=42.59 TRINITY_DN18344_c0_g1_i1:82-735(+)